MELSPNNVLKRRAAAFHPCHWASSYRTVSLLGALVAASAPLNCGDSPKMLVLDLKLDMVP